MSFYTVYATTYIQLNVYKSVEKHALSDILQKIKNLLIYALLFYYNFSFFETAFLYFYAKISID